MRHGRERAPQEPGRSRLSPDTELVVQSEGNEAMREGCRDVGARHSSCEVGERDPRGPGGAKGEPDYGTDGGTDAGDSELRTCLNETAADS